MKTTQQQGCRRLGILWVCRKSKKCGLRHGTQSSEKLICIFLLREVEAGFWSVQMLWYAWKIVGGVPAMHLLISPYDWSNQNQCSKTVNIPEWMMQNERDDADFSHRLHNRNFLDCLGGEFPLSTRHKQHSHTSCVQVIFVFAGAGVAVYQPVGLIVWVLVNEDLPLPSLLARLITLPGFDGLAIAGHSAELNHSMGKD